MAVVATDDLVRRVRAELIRDGLAEVKQAYPEGTPERKGATVGLLLCETLTTADEYAGALEERHDEERRLRCGIGGDLAAFWEHRYATLQVEYVYERLRLFWNVGETVSARAVVKVAEIIERISP
jgi:hypothetical protein